MRWKAILGLVILAFGGRALAQTSASYRLTEWTFNGGGDPRNGSYPSSPSFHVRLDSMSDPSPPATLLRSTGFHVEDGFVDIYRPSGEVQGLLWTSKTTLVWNPEPSAGSYDLYRNLLSALPGSNGTCLQSHILGTTGTDSTLPRLGEGWFYLATARNRVGEEGTLGYASSGAKRANTTPCP